MLDRLLSGREQTVTRAALSHRVPIRPSRAAPDGPLLKDGVRIYRWTGRMIHAKTAVIDGALGIVGSSNLDSRSLFAAHELNVAFRDPALGSAMRAMFLEDTARAEELEIGAWARRPLGARLASAAASLLRRWL
ncbi:MAG: phospholipase D-like domain-containing protein [Gemmatimonadota bacterium]